MKVCFLSTVDFSRMTAATVYCEYLKNNSIQFDIIYVDRKGQQAPNPYGAKKEYGYIPKSNIKWNPVQKFIIGYIPFRKYAIKIIEDNKYDFIIIWNELTAFLFSDIVRKRFKKKYCINIRDYQYFDYRLIRNRINKAVINSYFTTLSSFCYEKYFDHDNVYLLYGTKISGIDSIERKTKVEKGPINLLYIGQIGFLDYVYKIIDALGNDSRFNLIFAGAGSDIVMNYAVDKNINNIECYGRFTPDETIKYLNKGDILYNLYGTNSKHLTMAISLKYYYSLYMRIPIMVFDNTAMAVMSKKSHNGIILNQEDMGDLANRMYSWYKNIDFGELQEGCNKMITAINGMQENIYRKLDEVLESL